MPVSADEPGNVPLMSPDQPRPAPVSTSDEPRVPLTATGESVIVRPPSEADIPAYTEAVTLSSMRLSHFAMPDPHNLPQIIARQSPTFRTFMVWAKDADGSHGLVGRINVANVVQGAFRNATIGYDAYDPYAGRGLFAEGLELTISLCFDDEPYGLGLHRLEANIQPSNPRSAGVIRSMGFIHEGFSRDFLNLSDASGAFAWRDHDRYAMLADNWPSVPYRAKVHRRICAVVNGRPPAIGAMSVGRQVANELGLPFYDASVLEPQSLVWDLLNASPMGGVVACNLNETELRIGLARARFGGFDVPMLPLAEDLPKREVAEIALRVRAAFAQPDP